MASAHGQSRCDGAEPHRSRRRGGSNPSGRRRGARGVRGLSLLAGADGAILALAALVPDLCVKLWSLVKEGKVAEARALQRTLMPLARSVGGMHGVSGLKAALDLIGLRGGYPRPPLRPVPPAVVSSIREQLDALGVLAARA